ncbi:MAG: TonB-dependent receptor [Proteobacteria bacterium]|nr:TonB-dependent receptor [Pseudomonadota bacterium]
MFKKTRICKGLMLAFGGSIAIGALPMQALAQKVEITGSSIKRIEAEGALQVQTLTRADIDRTGAQTTEQLLQTISAMSSSGGTMTNMAAGLDTYGSSGVSLRGLGEERTLVLMNGRRLAAFAGGGGTAVNVNNIPLAAIERVEILKDGASAIYGSDAVAGVVNFILAKNFQGFQIGGTYGSPTQSGGGEQYQANIVAGWGDIAQDRFNLTVSGQYSRNKELFGRDRDFSKTANKPPYFESGATGQGNIQGPWATGVPVANQSADYLGGSGSGYGNPLASPTNKCGQINMALAPSLSAGGQPFCNFDTGPFVGLLGETETTSLTGNFVFRLNDKAELFADALWAKTIASATYQPSPLRTSFMETDEEFANQGIDPVLLLRPTNPNYQIAADYLNANGLGAFVGQDLGITARVFDFGPRSEENESTQMRIVGGVRGDFMEQSYNIALTYNENKLDGRVTDGYFSQVGFAKATQAPGSDWNPWSLTQSQAFRDAIAPAKYVGGTLSAKSTNTVVDATLAGDVLQLPAGMMQYAAGYQYRSEKLEQTPAPAQFSGDIAGLGGATKPLDADRTINAFYGELNIPVIKNLDANLAARWDDYSDFGSTTNWKGSFRWQPVQQVMFRGSYATGFRAPTLSDLYDPQVLQTSSQFDDPVTGQTDLQVNDLNGGNPDLEPETSKQYSLGIIFQPMPSLAIGLDYFNITVDDVISAPSTQEIVSQAALGNPAYTALVTRNPPCVGAACGPANQIVSTKTLLANTGRMEVQGMDLDFRFREKFGPGLLGLYLNSTYYFKFDQSTPGAGTSQKVATTVDNQGNPVIASTNGQDGYGVILRYKQYASATWLQGDWATTLGNNYATGYRAGFDLNGNPTYISAMSLWDLQVAYSGIKNAVLTLGARNIFDTQPDTFVNVSNAFQSGYDPSQYDPRGRFVYLTGTFKF